jgi:hypothetical protein
MEYCKRNPDICLKYGKSKLYYPTQIGRPPETRRERRELANGKVFNTNYLLEINKPPDAYTQNVVGEGVKVLRKNLRLGSQEVQHNPKEVLNAYLSQGAYENAYKSTNEAEAYIRKGSKLVPELENIRIIRNPRFTNNNHTAYRNVKTGEVYLAYRGSDGEFFAPDANVEALSRGKQPRIKNAVDWGTNLYTLAGKEHTTKRYKDAVSTAKALAEYTKTPYENLNLTGHSLGGGQADHTAESIGGKSVSFDPARNPFANRPVKETAKIESHSTLFDPVSLGRHIHEKAVGRPKHIEHKIYTASLGNEEGFVNQHLLEEQFIKPLKLKEGKIVSTRTTPLRNTLGMLGDFKGREGITNLVAPYALTPEYETKGEKAFRVAENYSDTLKMTTAMSSMLYRTNPAFALLDTPAMMGEIMSIDPMLPPDAKNWVLTKLGKEVPKPKYTPPPKIIQKINKALDKITGRYTADQHLQHDIEQAEKLNISLDEYLSITHGRGFEDAEKDVGVVFSDEDRIRQAQERIHHRSALAYSPDEAHEIAMKYHESSL